ncbi:MAG: hypothetical protein JWQ38_3193 [Flavipsychrobacter sp.]|nr:hypothetical protein [Flavipsychrobacter sp.]
MRKIIVLEFMSLDGVVQAPGGPVEDAAGSFKYSGCFTPVFLPKLYHNKQSDANT